MLCLNSVASPKWWQNLRQGLCLTFSTWARVSEALGMSAPHMMEIATVYHVSVCKQG